MYLLISFLPVSSIFLHLPLLLHFPPCTFTSQFSFIYLSLSVFLHFPSFSFLPFTFTSRFSSIYLYFSFFLFIPFLLRFPPVTSSFSFLHLPFLLGFPPFSFLSVFCHFPLLLGFPLFTFTSQFFLFTSASEFLFLLDTLGFSLLSCEALLSQSIFPHGTSFTNLYFSSSRQSLYLSTFPSGIIIIRTKVGAQIFLSPQIAIPQILALIPLLQIRKFLR